jgi:phosphodiester glycosidase
MPALAPLVLAAGLVWHAVQPGVWRAEAAMAARGPLASVRAVALRLDPAQVSFGLQAITRDMGTRPAWTVDSLPPEGLAACNAGQFAGPEVWGWWVSGGRELQSPGSGRLAMAFVVDPAGRAALVGPDELSQHRGRVSLAFQSYPALLVGRGSLPWELRARGRGADLDHRDSRLAIGTRPDGSVVIVLTRFAGLGHAGEQLPWGPTVGEMADWMHSLGCRRAMLLDGGMSSQLAVRTREGTLARWPNWRAVPLGLVVLPREAAGVAALAR